MGSLRYILVRTTAETSVKTITKDASQAITGNLMKWLDDQGDEWVVG